MGTFLTYVKKIWKAKKYENARDQTITESAKTVDGRKIEKDAENSCKKHHPIPHQKVQGRNN